MLKDSGARIVVLERATVSRLAVGGATTILLDDEAAFTGEGEANLGFELRPSDKDLCLPPLHVRLDRDGPKACSGCISGTDHPTACNWWLGGLSVRPRAKWCAKKTALSVRQDSIWEMFGGPAPGGEDGRARRRQGHRCPPSWSRRRARHPNRDGALAAARHHGQRDRSRRRVARAQILDAERRGPALDLCVDFRQDLPEARLLPNL